MREIGLANEGGFSGGGEKGKAPEWLCLGQRNSSALGSGICSYYCTRTAVPLTATISIPSRMTS